MKNSVCWNQDQGPGKYDFCTLSGDNSHKMCAYRFRCDKGNDYPSGKNAYSKKQYDEEKGICHKYEEYDKKTDGQPRCYGA